MSYYFLLLAITNKLLHCYDYIFHFCQQRKRIEEQTRAGNPGTDEESAGTAVGKSAGKAAAAAAEGEVDADTDDAKLRRISTAEREAGAGNGEDDDTSRDLEIEAAMQDTPEAVKKSAQEVKRTIRPVTAEVLSPIDTH